MLDQSKLENMLGRLEQYRSILQEIAALSREELLSKPALVGGAKYYLQSAIACCIDVAYHIIATLGWRAPKSYADAFVVLNEHGILPDDFVPTTTRMVRFRNRLVHLYWEVDDDMVYEILQRDLPDFDRFMVYVKTFLKEYQQEG